jgi:hypothetical protein
VALVTLHLVVTWALVGLIWTVQLVHYPLLAFVGREGFAAYAARHSRVITPLVGPLMLLELASAVWLALRPPPGVPWAVWGVGLALTLVIWASTAFVQVPLHRAFASGFSADAVLRLVRTNWIRTLAWSARGLLVGWAALLLMS